MLVFVSDSFVTFRPVNLQCMFLLYLYWHCIRIFPRVTQSEIFWLYNRIYLNLSVSNKLESTVFSLFFLFFLHFTKVG